MKRVVTGLATCAVLFALTPPAAAVPAGHAAPTTGSPAPASLPGTVLVSPASGTSADHHDRLLVLAGSSSDVIYASAPYTSVVSYSPRPTQLHAVTSDGTVMNLGDYEAGVQWSLVGDTLTAQPSYPSTVVDWINISTGIRGTGSIPAGGSYLGATPDGWAYLLGNEVFRSTTAGVVTSLGEPLGNADGEEVNSGTTGPDGVLVSDQDGAVAYVPYRDPTHPVTPAVKDLTGAAGPVYLRCVLRATDALCARSFDPGPFASESALELLSLTGEPAVDVSPADNRGYFREFALGDGVIVTSNDVDAARATDRSGGDVNSVPGEGDARLTSAFGNVVGTNADNTAIDAIAVPSDQPRQLVAPRLSTIYTYGSVMSAGRIVYADDEPSDLKMPTWSRSVENVHGTVVLGPRRSIGNTHGFAMSGATIAQKLRRRSVKIRTPLGLHKYDVKARHLDGLSGNRALVGCRRVLNLMTQTLSRAPKSSFPSVCDSLWGNYLTYMKSNASVWRLNLVTGKSVKVWGPPKSAGRAGVVPEAVDSWGDYVAWTYYVNGGGLHRRYVNVRGGAKPINLPADPSGYFALTSNGILHGAISGTYPKTFSFSLIAYGRHGATRQLITATDSGSLGVLAVGAQADASVFKWTDSRRVYAAPLEHVVDRPRSLGDPGFARTFKSTGDKRWRMSLPFSAAMSSCRVTLRRGHTTLRTLRCNALYMSEGAAYVTWNGKDKHGHAVSPGEVTWTVHASNSDGSALAPDGSTKAIGDVIRVSR